MDEPELDEWLSRLLGKPAYALGGLDADVSVQDFIGRIEASRDPNGYFVYAKVRPEEIDAIYRLEELGFRLVDTQVTFSRALDRSVWNGDAGVRPARPSDQEAVAELAERSFSYSRFHIDPLIGASAADSIKREWARNYFTGGRGTAMVVAEARDRIIGFLQLIEEKERVVIDLIAVAAEGRGRGVARAMIAFAMKDAAPTSQVIAASTQLANEASLRLYQSIGMVLVDSCHVFHLHDAGRTVG